MSLKDIPIAISYSTKRSDPIEDFFKPVLSQAIEYNVAVGYFSSAWIKDNSYGIARFAGNGGRARWIISPFDLSVEDRKLFIEAYKEKSSFVDHRVKDKITHNFEVLFSQLNSDSRTALAWLILDGVVEFKMGIPYADDGSPAGILHSKMGYFCDSEGNEISFSGSYNLTGQAQAQLGEIRRI
jgi:hypothetical protein